MSKRLIGPLGIGAATMFYSFAAAGQSEAAARLLFDRGIEAMGRRDFATCAKNLAASQRRIPQLTTLYYLATCEWVEGKIASADVHLEQFLAGVKALSLDKQAKHQEKIDDAEKIRETVSAAIPKLILVLPSSAPLNLEIVFDGMTLAAGSIDVPIRTDPGEHIIRTQVPGGTSKECRFTIARKETKRIELEFELPVLQSPKASKSAATMTLSPKPLQDQKRKMSWTGGIVAFGVGLTGFAVGGITALVAKSDRDVVNDVCPGGICPSLGAKGTGREAWNRGFVVANVATVGFGIGIVGVAVGTVMLIGGSRRENPPPRQTTFVVDLQSNGFVARAQGVFP